MADYGRLRLQHEHSTLRLCPSDLKPECAAMPKQCRDEQAEMCPCEPCVQDFSKPPVRGFCLRRATELSKRANTHSCYQAIPARVPRLNPQSHAKSTKRGVRLRPRALQNYIFSLDPSAVTIVTKVSWLN